MLIGCVIQYQINDDANATFVRLIEQPFEVAHRPVLWVDIIIVGYVVAMIRRRGVDGHEPDAGDSQGLQIIEFSSNTVKVPDPISISVVETADEDFIEDGALPPGLLANRFWGEGRR